MPNGDPRDGFFYPTLTLMINSYNPNTIVSLLIEESISILIDFSLTVKAATLIFISGCGSAISSDKEGKSGFIYNLVTSLYAF